MNEEESTTCHKNKKKDILHMHKSQTDVQNILFFSLKSKLLKSPFSEVNHHSTKSANEDITRTTDKTILIGMITPACNWGLRCQTQFQIETQSIINK